MAKKIISKRRRTFATKAGGGVMGNEFFTDMTQRQKLERFRREYGLPLAKRDKLKKLSNSTMVKASKSVDTIQEAHNASSARHNAVRDYMKNGHRISAKVQIKMTHAPDLDNKDMATVPVSQVNMPSSFRTLSGTEKRTVHKTMFHTGNPPTKAVRDAAKLHGTINRAMDDSKITLVSAEERGKLSHEFGFNSRNFHLVSATATGTTNKLLRNLSIQSREPLPLPNLFEKKILLSVMNVKQQYMFHNMSHALPINLKVHFFKIKNAAALDNDITYLLQKSFATTSSSIGGVNSPYFMHSNAVIQGEPTSRFTRTSSMNMSLKGSGLLSSPTFNDHVEIIHTVSKKLDHGDFWNLTHVHHCGAGLDLRDLLVKNTQEPTSEEYTEDGRQGGPSLPFTYGVIVESKGYPSECIIKLAGGGEIEAPYQAAMFIGTANGSYNYEHRTAVEFVRQPTVGSSVNDTDEVTEVFNEVHRRVFVKSAAPLNVELNQKEIFVLPSNMVYAESNLVENGQAFIPAISEDRVRNVGNRPQQDVV